MKHKKNTYKTIMFISISLFYLLPLQTYVQIIIQNNKKAANTRFSPKCSLPLNLMGFFKGYITGVRERAGGGGNSN